MHRRLPLRDRRALTITAFRALIVAVAILAGLGLTGRAQALTCDPPALGTGAAWFPVTPLPGYQKPAPHPAPDCPFYQAAWQQFLFDTKPDASGAPAFLRYPGLDTVFAQAGAAPEPSNGDGVLLTMNAGANQVMSDGVLIDRDGYPVFYAIHLNPAYAAFIRKNGLDTRAGILDPAKNELTFPAGVAEYKSAWRVLSDPADFPNYLTVKARVPRLHVVGGRLVADPSATYVTTVGLIGLHVVFALDGHPEMIWSTFEHVDREGGADLAPQALVNPEQARPPLLISPNAEYILFRRGSKTVIDQVPPTLADYAASLDGEGRRFGGGTTPLTTPVYRSFPGSNFTRASEDDEVLLLNAGVRAQLLTAGAAVGDRRVNYRLVGATWLDRPDDSFLAGIGFANAADQTTKTGPVAGQDALSSVAMESFTQVERPGCFSCHNTESIVVSRNTSIPDRLLNVSHLLSHYLQSLGE
jgi:hypothetical protein